MQIFLQGEQTWLEDEDLAAMVINEAVGVIEKKDYKVYIIQEGSRLEKEVMKHKQLLHQSFLKRQAAIDNDPFTRQFNNWPNTGA